jgi:mono/diheme cytochrome c family protein
VHGGVLHSSSQYGRWNLRAHAARRYSIRMIALKSSVLVLTLACAAFSADKVARGKYLVEEVAKCQDCHTPRGPDGQLDKASWLKGAVLDFQPIQPVPGWHKASPDLTSGGALFQRWGEKGLVEFLKTGKGPKGNPAGPPMPTYTMDGEDAAAMVAYLKSLK